jgi:hypothetical protein
MRFVLGNRLLDHAGGTEVHLVTLGRELLGLGHEVRLYSPRLGPYADHAVRCGLEVSEELRALPADCDVVLAQDAIVSYDLAERFPDALQVFRICGDVYDFQAPPQVPGMVDLIVVLSERYQRLAGAVAVTAPVVRLRVPIAIDMLVPVTPLRPRPQRAVLLGNYPQRDELIREVWGRQGVEVVRIGGRAGQRYDLTDALAEVDVVVAKSRAALDAMSCGRAVYVYDAFGGDGWVTPSSYPAMEADIFSGQATERMITPVELERDLEGYDPAMGMVNRDLVALHHSARAHAVAFVEAVSGRVTAQRPDLPLRELGRLTALQWSWQEQARGLQCERAELISRVMAAEQSGADQALAIQACRDRVTELEVALGEANMRVAALAKDLEETRNTRTWRVARMYWRARDRLTGGVRTGR